MERANMPWTFSLNSWVGSIRLCKRVRRGSTLEGLLGEPGVLPYDDV